MAKSISLAKLSQAPRSAGVMPRRRPRSRTASVFNRHPYFQATIAGERIEALVVALEAGRIGRFQCGRRQPLIPNRVDGAANGGDVVTMREHCVALFRN